MRNKLVLAIAIVLSAIISVAIATPAQAADSFPCSNGWVCIYEHQWTDTPRYVIVDQYLPGFCFDIPANWDNRADSVTNLTNHTVTFYTGNICATPGLDPKTFPRDAHRNFELWDDGEANSMRFN